MTRQSSDEQEDFLQRKRFGGTTSEGPLQRLFLAAAALIGGNGVLLLLLLLNALRWRSALLSQHVGDPTQPFLQTWQMFILYAIFSFAGWVVVGLPIAFLIPAHALLRLYWPLKLLVGTVLGPVALFLILFILTAIQGGRGTFTLARTGSLWPLSILVSAVSFLCYIALLRWRLSDRRS